MRGTLVAALVCCIAAATVSAVPSYSAVMGLNRTVDARPIGAGEYSFGLFTMLGISPDGRAASLPSGLTEVTDTELDFTAYLTAAAGLGRSAEIGARISYIINSLSRGDREGLASGSEGDDGFSEAHLFLKYTLNPDSDRLWFGVMPWIGFALYDGGNAPYVLNTDGWDGIWEPGQPMFQMRRPMINAGSVSFGGDFLMTYDFDPMLAHLNLGYHYFKQSFEFTDYRYDAGHNPVASEDVDMEVEDPVFHAATGFEFPLNNTTSLYAELEWRHFMKRDFEEGDGEDFDDCIQFAPGARFAFESGFAFDVTGSFCISEYDPAYNDLGHRYFQQGQTLTSSERARYAPFPEGYAPKYGIGVNVMYSTELIPREAVMTGMVFDAQDGGAVAASVAFPGSDAGTVMSSADTGDYTAELPAGEYTVVVSADGYITHTESVQAGAGEMMAKDFGLVPMAGAVGGTVTDAGTGAPIRASIAVDGSQAAGTAADGTYEIEVSSGSHTMTAAAAGYASDSKAVTITSDEVQTVDFELDMILEFESVYFDFDSAVLRSDAKAVLDDVAAVLVENPGITVRITGNTDSEGPEDYNMDLAERRAAAVREYLIGRGVSAGSLSTVSYGEEQPAVPNTSKENRALNRRAEFIVLGQMTD